MKKKTLLILVASLFLFLFGVPVLLVILIRSNGAPILPDPGPTIRMGHYLTHHVADTKDNSIFPEMAPLILSTTPTETFPRVRQTIELLGWEVIEADLEKGTLHAIERTALWKFVDDVHFEVSSFGTDQTTVHLRSESRVGKGDLGANLGRILRFKKTLETLSRTPGD